MIFEGKMGSVLCCLFLCNLDIERFFYSFLAPCLSCASLWEPLKTIIYESGIMRFVCSTGVSCGSLWHNWMLPQVWCYEITASTVLKGCVVALATDFHNCKKENKILIFRLENYIGRGNYMLPGCWLRTHYFSWG